MLFRLRCYSAGWSADSNGSGASASASASAPAPGDGSKDPAEVDDQEHEDEAGVDSGTAATAASEKNELAKELHLIESTIRERENEITMNHLRIVAAAASDSGVDCSIFGGIVAGGKQQQQCDPPTTTFPTPSSTSSSTAIWGGDVVSGWNSAAAPALVQNSRIGVGRG